MLNKNAEELAEKIRAEYQPREATKLDALQKLDRKVKLPAEIFAYVFGVAAALILGIGMVLAMKVIGNLMPLGIVIGLAGIAMCAGNYYIYRAILTRRKRKYAKQITSLSDELLNNRNYPVES